MGIYSDAQKTMRRLRKAPAGVRLHECKDMIVECQRLITELRDMRGEAVREMIVEGYSIAAISREMGVTISRVCQLRSDWRDDWGRGATVEMRQAINEAKAAKRRKHIDDTITSMYE